MKIPLIKPYIDQSIINRVSEVLESRFLTEGPVTKEFEREFSKYIGCKYSIAVSSCTTGLEIALRALKIGPGDEVIVPDYTYPATASVVPIVGATAVIVDVDRKTMLIDYDAIEKAITLKTKAIIPVSAFGNPLDYDRLLKIKDKYGLFIVEDAAPSVGAEFKGKKTGNISDITVFSFHPRKFITTGEGGMVTTNNKGWADWMISYKHFGMNMAEDPREKISFDIIGTNYKMSNVLAAIGLGQMKHIDHLLQKRRSLAENYTKLLSDFDDFSFPKTTPGGKHSFQSFCIFLRSRNKVMKKMRKQGIEVQIGTYSLHMHKAFNSHSLIRINDNMLNSRWCYDNTLTLPLYHDLSYEQQKYIVKTLKHSLL